MGLVGADSILGMVQAYRTLLIDGRYGGGKTSLAVEIAGWLLEHGKVDYLISNVPCVWRDDPAKIILKDGYMVNAVVILDEAGLFMETGADAKKFMAFLRKMNIILIMPTVLEPSRMVQMLSVQRVMKWDVVGLPLWWYRATLRYKNQKEAYSFGWWKPSNVFGIYDTVAAPSDDGGLSEWMVVWTDELQKATGVKIRRGVGRKKAEDQDGEFPALSGSFDGSSTGNSERSLSEQLQALEVSRRTAELNAEAAGQMAETVSLLEQQNNRKRRN